MTYRLYMDRKGTGKCVGVASNLNDARKKACKLIPRPSVTKKVYIFKDGKHIGTLDHNMSYSYSPEYETVITWEFYNINPNTGRTM